MGTSTEVPETVEEARTSFKDFLDALGFDHSTTETGGIAVENFDVVATIDATNIITLAGDEVFQFLESVIDHGQELDEEEDDDLSDLGGEALIKE